LYIANVRIFFGKLRAAGKKRLQWFLKNDRSGFGKRPQSFLETTALVSHSLPPFLPLCKKKCATKDWQFAFFFVTFVAHERSAQ